jgi:hypothetical protein
MPAAHVPPALLFAVALLSPTPSFAQLNVITSVGFEAAYNELVPVFQKTAGSQFRQSTSPRKAMDTTPLRRNFAQGRPRTSSF